VNGKTADAVLFPNKCEKRCFETYSREKGVEAIM
jgi:hypothetical protein